MQIRTHTTKEIDDYKCLKNPKKNYNCGGFNTRRCSYQVYVSSCIIIEELVDSV